MIKDALAIARYHIMLVAMAASLTFGWLMTGRYVFALLPVVGVDWFLINLMNRVTDVDEDRKNGIEGTERVARRTSMLTVFSFALMIGSIIATHMVWPALTPARIAVQLIGLGYNYKIVPTPRGLSRFKEIYFFKNFGSSVIFTFTGFVYPLIVTHGTPHMSFVGIAALIVFFVLYEMTYEIIYDLRDLDGDRAEGVPTYPVVHGPDRARQIIDALLVAASLALLVGFFLRALGVRELLMLAAPVLQFFFYRARFARGLTARDCIVMTHTGSVLLVIYLVGTFAWLRLGLPPNVTL